LQRTITAAKAGLGFEHFRCFLVIPTGRVAMDKDSDREELEEKLEQSRRLAADQ
jgi:hypothetical protein